MLVNQEYINSKLDHLKENYTNAVPFPSIAFDNFLTENCIREITADFPPVSDKVWTHYIHYNEKKHGLTKWEHFPKSVQDLVTEMGQKPFINWLEQLTGINNLFADPDLEGSGLHQTLPGGFLNIHADFTVHPRHKDWHRRVNVLIYLNDDWNEEWGGHLELWDENMQNCVQKIAPSYNKIAIFSTGKKTYHGHPTPIICPEGYSRKSLAMYFYTKEDDFEKIATDYRSRPSDGSKKILIWADTKLISFYSKMKGFLGIDDTFVSSILNLFNNKR